MYKCVNCYNVTDDSTQVIGIAPLGKQYPCWYLCVNCYNERVDTEKVPEINYVVVERVQMQNYYAHVALATYSTQEEAEEFKSYCKSQYHKDTIIIHEIQNSV